MLEILASSSAGTRSADVCIVGAGPAGISLSLALARAGVSSILLEGGLLDGPGSYGSASDGRTREAGDGDCGG